jgi:hypothetical protein
MVDDDDHDDGKPQDPKLRLVSLNEERARRNQQDPWARCALMKAISALPIRAVPKLPFVGARCRSWEALALANAVVRQQSWVGKPVIWWMPDQ